MEKKQKITLLILAILGTLYFAAFWPLNAETYGSDNPIVYLDRDEYVTYPIVERMLAFEGDIHQIWGRLIVYGDYHYGYPFYFFSMLCAASLPAAAGREFFQSNGIQHPAAAAIHQRAADHPDRGSLNLYPYPFQIFMEVHPDLRAYPDHSRGCAQQPALVASGFIDDAVHRVDLPVPGAG